MVVAWAMHIHGYNGYLDTVALVLWANVHRWLIVAMATLVIALMHLPQCPMVYITKPFQNKVIKVPYLSVVSSIPPSAAWGIPSSWLAFLRAGFQG